MAGMTLKAEIFSINSAAAAEVVKAFCQSAMYAAIRVFLKACLARIPVRTGFLKGAFREIGPAFGAKDTVGSKATIPFQHPTFSGTFEATLAQLFSSKQVKELFKERETLANAKNAESHSRRLAKVEAEKNRGKKEYYTGGGSRVLKTPSSGVKFVTPVREILTSKGANFTFNLQVDISYYRIMDFFGRHGHGPWRSLQAGEKAMLEYLVKAAANQKLLIAMLGTTTITLNSSGVITKTEKKFEVAGSLKEFTVKDAIPDIGVASEVLAVGLLQQQQQREQKLEFHRQKLAEARAKKELQKQREERVRRKPKRKKLEE